MCIRLCDVTRENDRMALYFVNIKAIYLCGDRIKWVTSLALE